MLRKARQNLEGYNVTLRRGELHELDLPQRGFDRVICSEVLEHVVDPDTVLRGIRPLLAHGARLVVTFPNDQLVNRLKGAVRRCGLTVLPPFRRIAWGGDHYHLHVWSIAEMRALLSRYFTIARARFAPSRVLPIRCCFQCTASK